MYLNAETLGRLLSKYGDPHTNHVYLGQWKVLEKYYLTPRIADKENVSILLCMCMPIIEFINALFPTACNTQKFS